MRLIALLTDGFGGRGGIAKFNRDFLTALCALPAVDRIDCVYRHAPESSGNSPANLHTLRSATRGKIFFAVYAIFLAVRPQRVAMVVCGHLNMLVLAWAIAKIRRAKLLCVLHGVEGWQPNGNRLVNWLVRHADVYVVVSVLTQRRFQAWSGVSANRFALLPNCFESGVFAPGLKDPTLLARYGISDNVQVLMTLGRLAGRERYKGFDEIIDLLPDLRPEIVYMIVGDGDDRQRLESKARERGVSERVIFTGYVGDAEKAAHYRLADAFLLVGRGEGFGIVLLEAMACAIPCIGSVLDGTAEALRDGQLGLVIDPTNREALRDAIEASLRKPKLVPPGLEYFSTEQFHARARAVLSRILADEIAA